MDAAPRSEDGQHAVWCVRDHSRGACSPKRGKWDRSTNTWTSDFTEAEREVMREAMRRWREEDQPFKLVMIWVKEQPGFAHVSDRAMQTWWMTRRKAESEGKTWP